LAGYLKAGLDPESWGSHQVFWGQKPYLVPSSTSPEGPDISTVPVQLAPMVSAFVSSASHPVGMAAVAVT
jgi:hypothetical protein